jgi:hypothetical protein
MPGARQEIQQGPAHQTRAQPWEYLRLAQRGEAETQALRQTVEMEGPEVSPLRAAAAADQRLLELSLEMADMGQMGLQRLQPFFNYTQNY